MSDYDHIPTWPRVEPFRFVLDYLKLIIANTRIRRKPMETTKKVLTRTTPVKKVSPKKTAYTARELAKEVGLPSASVARRYLRAAEIKKPRDGWVWADKASAKDALAVVSRAVRGATK